MSLTIIEAQDALLNLEKRNKSKFQNSICLSSFDSFGYDQNIVAKYFSIWCLFTYWSFSLLVPLIACRSSVCCITDLIAFLHFFCSLAKSRLKHFFIQVSVNHILPTKSGSTLRS